MAKTKPSKKKSKAQKSYREAVLKGDIKASAGQRIFSQQDMEPTTAGEWKKAPANYGAVPLPLPSGNTALVQPLGIPGLLRQGLIPNPLLSTVTNVLDDADLRMENPSPEALVKAERKRRKRLAESMDGWARDPTMMLAVFDMADAVCLACVEQPEVLPKPDPNEDGSVSREDGKLYIDEVDFDDKLYIMSYAMAGVRDLESFRNELAGSVGTALDGPNMASAPESVAEPDGV